MDLDAFLVELESFGVLNRKQGLKEGHLMLEAARVIRELSDSDGDVIHVGADESLADAVARHFDMKLVPWQRAHLDGRRKVG